MRWTLTDHEWHLVDSHVAEGAREIGILWLVFSLLDRLVSSQLTAVWGILNILAALAVWGFGMYFDVVRRR